MLKTLFFIGYLFSGILCAAQNDLQRCAEEKNKAIIKIVEDKNWNDSASTRKLQALNEEWKNCVLGKQVPDFEMQTLDGKKISAAKLKGNVVVINFWFTTCPPCVAEMPAFNKLVAEYKNKKVTFLGMTFNDKKTVNDFLKKKPFAVKIIPNAEKMEDLFGILEHPVTLIIDKENKIRLAIAGSTIGDKAVDEAYAKIKPVIDELINQ